MRSLVPTKAKASNGTTHVTTTPSTALTWGPDRLFDRLVSDFWGAGEAAAMKPEPTALDIVELDDSIRISLEVPGIDPKDLDISLTGQILSIVADKHDENEELARHRTYAERSFGTIRRSVKLPCPVEADKVEAAHKYGVVIITLQKSEMVRPKRIKIAEA